MDVFELCKRLVDNYGSYVSSSIRIKDAHIEQKRRKSLDEGLLWPDPLIQLNPSFEAGQSIDELVEEDILLEKCARMFRVGKGPGNPGVTLRRHRHQSDAIRTARDDHNYVLITGKDLLARLNKNEYAE